MTKIRVIRLFLLLFALLGLVVTTSCGDAEKSGDGVGTAFQPATVPSGFVDDLIASGIGSPTAMAFAPDGRLFVAQQGGQLRVITNANPPALLSTPFLTVTVSGVGERGLLGIAFDPAFATNRFVYIYYTATTPAIHNRVSRFTASSTNPNVAQSGETILLELNNLSSATNHNGGAMHFGPDGKLYIAVGENANRNNAQVLTNLLGKMLRINSDGTIPTDNPFFGQTTGSNRAIWAFGLRNPFTFGFQPGSTRMFINDVGEGSWEEINDGIAGSNYGWPQTEGVINPPQAGLRGPLFAYPHSGPTETSGCAITGGAFYNPSTVQFPSSFVGRYFYGEHCNGWLRTFNPANGATEAFATGLSNLVDIKVRSDGTLWYLQRGGSPAGQVHRVRFAQNQPPSITQHPSNLTVAAGQTATFTVAASGSQPLSFQWQRNGTNIPGATSPTLSFPAAIGDNGAMFRAVVTNAFGTATSNSATLTVSGSAPTASITAPAQGATYAAGDTINFSGTGTDPQDGTLPASAFSWDIVFHHDTHTHPFMTRNGVTSGSVVIPNTGEIATNVFYRFNLTVRDSGGLTHTVSRDILPRTSTITLASNPSGRTLTLDGTPFTAPMAFPNVVGMLRSIGAPSPQTLGSTNYTFSSWSDGGAQTHTISTPATSTTYTASFTASPVTGGLNAEYFDNIDLTNRLVTRVDPTVNFNFGTGSPDPSIGPDTFSARWTGTVTPQFSQPYTFYTTSDDGVRLWVNGVLVIDNWTDHAPTENSGTTATLTAGQAYSIRMEMYENGGGATATLSWSSASQPKQIIPSSRLNPAVPTRINFQLAGAPTPSGYTSDTGQLFGSRGGGLSFGWNVDHSDLTRDRNINADQRLDTLCHFHAGGQWEIALPNGSYSVFVSIGDSAFPSTHTLVIEGVTAFNAVALTPNQFRSATRTVAVADGRLTLTQGSAVDKATRINYVEITRL